jgi:hypothetical protein
VLEMVHRFYDEYYFRPKAVYRIVRKAIFNGEERKRLYKEARSFLKLRAARNKWVQEQRQTPVAPAAPPPNSAKAERETSPEPVEV